MTKVYVFKQSMGFPVRGWVPRLVENHTPGKDPVLRPSSMAQIDYHNR